MFVPRRRNFPSRSLIRNVAAALLVLALGFFARAKTFCGETQRKDIVPLHLLATIVAGGSSPSEELLRGAGFSLESLVDDARRGSDLL
jgi:hypothetical protein